MLAWGWRVPFLLSAILVIVGLVVRVHMEETPIFRMAQEQKKVVKSPLTEVFRKSWRQVLQATFLVAVTYTLFYTLATWSLAWGTKEQGEGGGNLGFTNQEYLLMLMISICVFALFIVLSCLYADKIGRRRVLTFSSCALVVFAVLFPFLLDGGLVGQKNFFANMVFLCVGFADGHRFGPIGASCLSCSTQRALLRLRHRLQPGRHRRRGFRADHRHLAELPLGRPLRGPLPCRDGRVLPRLRTHLQGD